MAGGNSNGQAADGAGASDAAAERAAVIEREQRFFDTNADRYQLVRRRISRAMGAFDRSKELHDQYDPAGKDVLDYGCGAGRFAMELLSKGARHVTGIDISAARVEEAKNLAASKGLAERTTFMVADAHDTGLPAASFDLIIGSDILHHLDIEAAATELRRMLKPDGAAIFIEPLAHHPLLRIGRRLTPSARTADEHPLTEDDWELLAAMFPKFRHVEVEFVTLPLAPVNLLLPRSLQQSLARRVAPVDDKLLGRFPSMRKYARRTILVMAV